MISRVLGIAVLVAVAGCSRAPRSADYFAAHPGLARAVRGDCAAGRVRDAECGNAELGDARAAAASRQAAYRKGF